MCARVSVSWACVSAFLRACVRWWCAGDEADDSDSGSDGAKRALKRRKRSSTARGTSASDGAGLLRLLTCDVSCDGELLAVVFTGTVSFVLIVNLGTKEVCCRVIRTVVVPCAVTAVRRGGDRCWRCRGVGVQCFRLPSASASARVTAVAFHPQDDTLAVACCNNQFTLYSGRTGALRDWSKEYSDRCGDAPVTVVAPPSACRAGESVDRRCGGALCCCSFPVDFLRRAIDDPVKFVSFNPAAPHTLLLAGTRYVCYVDLDEVRVLLCVCFRVAADRPAVCRVLAVASAASLVCCCFPWHLIVLVRCVADVPVFRDRARLMLEETVATATATAMVTATAVMVATPDTLPHHESLPHATQVVV